MSEHDTAGNDTTNGAENDTFGTAGAEGGPGADAGPPGGLPEQVPDFVSDIHGAINDFLSGEVDNLGEVVSGIAGAVSDALAQAPAFIVF